MSKVVDNLRESPVQTLVGLGQVVVGFSTGNYYLVASGGATLFSASQPTPDADGSLPDGRELRSRTDPTASRPVVYGTVRKGGTVVYQATSGDDNKYLHLVIALAGHEVNAIRDVRLNDFVYERHHVYIATGLGNDPERTVTLTINGTDFEATGSSALLLVQDLADAVRTHCDSNNCDYFIRSDTPSLWVSTQSPDGVSVSINDPENFASVETTDNRSLVRVHTHLGAADQAADSDLVSEVGEWTTDHRLRGIAYMYVRLEYDRDAFPGGTPNLTAVVEGKQVYDPRDGTTAHTDNAALCIADYLADATYGLGATYGTEIDETTLAAEANICDESVPLADGGSEKRYTCNGFFASDEAPERIIPRLLTAMAGSACYIGGQWVLRAGAYNAPTVTLDEDDLRGGIEMSPTMSKRDRANAVKGTYQSPENDWQPADFPPVKSSTALAEDNGERNWAELKLGFTTSPSMAQRLAKIELLRSRQQITATLRCKLTALRVRAGDTVAVDNARFGWSGKPFVVQSLRFVVEDGYIGVDLDLREIASNVYDWSTSEEQAVDPAPNTTLPDPFLALPPKNLSVTSGTSDLYRKADGTVVSRAHLTWTDSVDSYVQRYQVQYKRSAASAWNDAQPVEQGVEEAYLWDVEDGVAYDFRLRAINTMGVRSDWQTVTGHTIVGKTAPPSDMTGLAATTTNWISGGAKSYGIRLTWDQATDLDRAGYEIRAQDANWGSDGSDFLARPEGNSVQLPIASAGAYTFYGKVRDTTGNYSTTADSVGITISAPGTPSLTSRYDGADFVLGWSIAEGDFPLVAVAVRRGGTDWASAQPVDTVRAEEYRQPADWSGTQTWWAAGIDAAGNVGAAASLDAVVQTPGKVGLLAEVLDNNVLLDWDKPTGGTLPIAEYEIRKGASFGTATVLGTVDGTFKPVFESSSGTYTYWVVAVDSAGNLGTEEAITTAVDEPPDFLLKASFDSDPGWSGTRTNAQVSGDDLVVPVDTTETWDDHYTSNGWSTPQDQIDAGYPIYIQPTLGTAQYEEVFDVGTTLANSRVRFEMQATDIVAGVTTTPTVAVAPDDGAGNPGTWRTYAGSWGVYETDFRFVRITLDFAQSGDDGVLRIESLHGQADVKEITDSGTGTANAGDSGGTTVTFNKDFVDVESLTVTPKGATAAFATYDFVDDPNPTDFDVYLWDKDGNRVSGDFSWKARGIRA